MLTHIKGMKTSCKIWLEIPLGKKSHTSYVMSTPKPELRIKGGGNEICNMLKTT
jgi:hypothetical protein